MIFTFKSPIRKKLEWHKKVSNWHRWFAWYPVFIENEQQDILWIIWFSQCERKAVSFSNQSGKPIAWGYRI